MGSGHMLMESIKNNIMRCLFPILLISIGISLSGCLSSPTYGTDKSSTEQLFDDLINIVSLENQKGSNIEYKSRPGLVQPPSVTILPEPQTSVVKDRQVWPESPEEIRQRLLAEIEANKDKPGYRSAFSGVVVNGKSLTPKEQMEAYRKARALQKGTYSGRRYLSDPPPEYKIPAPTAPIGELGETEKAKEKRRLQEAQDKTSS